MSVEHTRLIIALLVIAGFFVVVTSILLGFVNIESPELAKLSGMIVGYLVALMNPIILRYFETHIPPPKE